MLQNLNLYKFEAEFIFLDSANLPKLKFNLIHAVFGKAFRDIACTTKQPECKNCMVYESCVYANVFQSELHSILGLKTTEKRAPHPYVLNHHKEVKTYYAQGDTFNLELVIFGEFIKFFPFYAMALKRIGENGLGKKRGKLKLISIKNFTEPNSFNQIYNHEKSTVSKPEKFSIKMVKENLPEKVILEFQTPVRIQNLGKILSSDDKLDEDLLLRTVYRRVLLVSKLYAGKEFDYSQDADGKIKILNKELWFEKFKRYSSVTKKEISMGGLKGIIELEINDPETYNLFYLGQFLNIGKNVSFGFGKYLLR